MTVLHGLPRGEDSSQSVHSRQSQTTTVMSQVLLLYGSLALNFA